MIKNKVIKIGIISIISATWSVQAQSGYDAVLQQIEANNTTLAALRQQTEAQKLGNRTGLVPANPEIEFNYLWGNPSVIGKRYDISVKQSFDFPTAYIVRNRMANMQNENAELSYKAERLNVLLSAKQTCIELVYYNALTREYAVRLQNAERIAEAYKSKLKAGEASALEHNKAQLNLTTVQAEVSQIEAERIALVLELKRLNGGQELIFSTNGYLSKLLPAHFEDWYALAESKNPVLQYVRGQIEIEQQQVKLSQALGLPKFSTGYMSEKVVGQHFQGVTVGMSIPLWENKNRVKQAKAQSQATEIVFEDRRAHFYNRLQTLYYKAAVLQQNAQKVRQSLSQNNNAPLLKKALDAGEISLLNYLLELEFYYNAINNALEAERDFELTMAELEAVEL